LNHAGEVINSFRMAHRYQAPPVPTIGELMENAPRWSWLYCNGCGRGKGAALAPFAIRWGLDASSDLIRNSVRCEACGAKGATMIHPSYEDLQYGWSDFPDYEIEPWVVGGRAVSHQAISPDGEDVTPGTGDRG
jgi:hypothetical protein